MAMHVTFIIFLISAFAGSSVGSPTTFEEGDDLVTFYLHNNELGDSELELTLENLNVLDSSKPIYFLTHGWNGGIGRYESWIPEATEAFLAVGDINVVQVDWSGPVSESDEAVMLVGAQLVAKSYGRLIATLIDDYSVPPSNIRVAGHSIGAHVSAIAAKTAKKLTGTPIAKVTALDPANFLDIESTTEDERLGKDDANLVVVIHTAGGEAGLLESLGAIDFFPNGGVEQPACENPGGFNACSHMIVTDYFVESIYNTNGFVAIRCASYEEYEAGSCASNKHITFGGELAAEDVGDYYLDTNSEKPYSKE